jgi:hypothetical protein
MHETAKRAVVCTVRDQAAAERLVRELHEAGFGAGDISVMFKNAVDTRGFAHENRTHEPEYLEHDVGVGAVAFGTFGVITGLISLGLPGPGWIAAAGPFALAAVAFAAAAGGGFKRALREFGVSHDDAKLYEDRLKDGAAIVAVHADDVLERRRAADRMAAAGAESISSVMSLAEASPAP